MTMLRKQKSNLTIKMFVTVLSLDKILTELVEKSNHFFKSLKASRIISEKELQYFTYKYKKQLVLVNCTCFLKLKKGYLMFQGGQ